MRRNVLNHNLQSLLFQRNILAALSLLLALSLAVGSAFLFCKRERVVVVPATTETTFWVDNHSVSTTYLEQFGTFLAQLLLSKSAASAIPQGTVLLRHTDPKFYPALKQKLIDEESRLRLEDASYVFYPVHIEADPQKLQIHLEGDRSFYLAGKQASHVKEAYTLSFSYSGSRLLLSGLQAKEVSDD